MKRYLAGLALGLMLLWATTGIMFVNTGEEALVYRFGAITRTCGAGLHLRLPFPIEQDERSNVTEVRRVEPGEVRLLTGDYNLVALDLVVQYTVADPVAMVLSVDQPQAVISAQVMSAATSTVASMEVDELLTTGRAALQRRVMSTAQGALDDLVLGVRLMAVDIRELVPPPAVVDAFNDVSSARGDRETIALSAEAYTSKLLPDVRGRAARKLEDSRARASQILAQAGARTNRFRVLLDAWLEDPEPVGRDMYLSFLDDVSPYLDIMVVPRGTEVVIPQAKLGKKLQ